MAPEARARVGLLFVLAFGTAATPTAAPSRAVSAPTAAAEASTAAQRNLDEGAVIVAGETTFSAHDIRTWLARSEDPMLGDALDTTLAGRRAALLAMAALTEYGRAGPAEVTRALRDRVLADALDRGLRSEANPSAEQMRQFYAEHRDRYQQPKAIRLWRILVASESAAKEIISAVDGKPKPVALWSNLAREQSLDEATKQRDGSLGFVRADGTTDVPELRVDPALFGAADQVADGELVKTPIAEGSSYAVVWRRGTRPARAQRFEDEQANIREILVRSTAQAARNLLIAELRSKNLTNYTPDLVSLLDEKR
ncbi:MAG TPA: peptidyl-prolyl cis-trans isomerase [Polyangiaceae bacterium]|jgi:hypothetical protein|nr:peptidyl-prolyl cis-trans isomerase [Polyangiaceae bacterium]